MSVSFTSNKIVFALIKDFDKDQDDKVSFGEFVSAFWAINLEDDDYSEELKDFAKAVIDFSDEEDGKNSRGEKPDNFGLSPPQVSQFLAIKD